MTEPTDSTDQIDATDVVSPEQPQGLPEKNKCDRHGNLLVYERNRQIWSIVSYQHYIEYAVCYERWEYLPEPPEPKLKTDVTSADVELVSKLGRLILGGNHKQAPLILKKHLSKFSDSAKDRLMAEYDKTDGSYNVLFLMGKM